MKKYYKVNVYSEYIDMEKINQCIIVERGLLYAKEIVTNRKIRICDNKAQGCMYDYYVLSNDFKLENIVGYDELKKYMDNFDLSILPIFSNLEEKHGKGLDK